MRSSARRAGERAVVYRFSLSCVESTYEAIRAMIEVEKPITLKTFRRRCDSKGLERSLGYDRGFPLCRDWHVGYYRSMYEGRRCYYLRWSGIEHIFLEGAE